MPGEMSLFRIANSDSRSKLRAYPTVGLIMKRKVKTSASLS
jgi:hypothetical protein